MLTDPLTYSAPGTNAHNVTFTPDSDATLNRCTLLGTEDVAAEDSYSLAVIPAHSLEMRRMVQLYRTYPKPSGVSRGTKRSSVKYTRDVEVPNRAGDGTVVMPAIVDIKVNLPVGTPDDVARDIRSEVFGFANNTYAVQEQVIADLTNDLSM